MTIHATDAFAFGSGTVSTTALTLADLSGITIENVEAAGRARITVSTDAIRYRYDGQDPTAAVGHYLPVNGQIELVGGVNINNFKAIRVTLDAELSVTLEAF